MIRPLAILVLVCAAKPAAAAESIEFRRDVIAALSRAGCNSGACHGSPQGKNGFRLSLRGGDPDLDFQTLAKENGGRRVNLAAPEESLFLLKGSGRVAHQGGALFARDSAAYRTLVRWVAEGCRDLKPAALVKLELRPPSGRILKPEQAIRAIAHFADGSTRDVTDLTVFTTAETDASISASGLAKFHRTADASFLARYLDGITSVRHVYVEPDPKFAFAAPPAANAIDRLAFAKQKELQLLPAAVCTDEVFLRRVYLDAIGTLPTADEARDFLDSRDPNKRAKLIDTLLGREEFALFWALKWADVLRGSPTTISERGVHSFHRYLVKAVAEDRPITDLARDLLTASGNTLNKPGANFYRVARTPEEAAETAAQLFLGIRVQCAKCHNHPFEGITQTDYYGLAAFFSQVTFKGSAFGLDDETVYLQPGREVQNPITRRPQPPQAFGAKPGPLAPDDDRRKAFAAWLMKPDNKYFAPSVANRVWFHLMGKGIVDPVDDFRDTNPPSNPELLQALADDFAKNGYRLKPLVRSILNSNVYQLANEAPKQSPHAASPDRHFIKSGVRMLAAEQVLDAVSQATGVSESFKGYPAGTRALDLPEGGFDHPFLQAFSRPVRDVVCECAREEDPSLPQVLHMLNNAGVLAKVRSEKGRVAGWLREGKTTEEVVQRIYLSTLSRRPTEKEVSLVKKHLAAVPDRTAGLQDVQHALLNLNEFLLRH